MLVFLDFEASSLSDQSYPIEVGWVMEDGAEEAHLIRPAPGWTDWDPRSEVIHSIPRAELENDGEPHDQVARRLVEALGGHDVRASAPSWDGKWLSTLLRAAGLPRHTLRLTDSDAAHAAAARAVLAPCFSGEALDTAVAQILFATERSATPAHRALADARAERQRWLDVRAAALEQLAALGYSNAS